jgi:oligoribonuclease NrnB/cAMP/cGMP phosphodiesterase (DHH superfamily)
MKKCLIIYHKDDNDGVVSCCIAYHHVTKGWSIPKENIDLLGADYNTLAEFQKKHTPKDLHSEYETVIVTDISFNDANYMKALYDEFGDGFLWFDHHMPIIYASHKLGFDKALGIRDTGNSALLNAWKFFYHENPPYLLRILSAYDSWTYEREGLSLDYVKKVNTGFTEITDLKVSKVLPIVDSLVDAYVIRKKEVDDNFFVNQYFNYGATIEEYERNKSKRILDNEGDTSWRVISDDGTVRTACAIFHQGPTNSQMFDSVKESCQNGIVFKHQKNGNWIVSLYNCENDPSFHCGDFMSSNYYGGGHAGAAGCTLTEDQMIYALKAKAL